MDLNAEFVFRHGIQIPFSDRTTRPNVGHLSSFSFNETEQNGTRARTDSKNPFHKSNFRRSTPCFKGSSSTRAEREDEDFDFLVSNWPPNGPRFVFHGERAHIRGASFPRKNLVFGRVEPLRHALVLANKGAWSRGFRRIDPLFEKPEPDGLHGFCFTATHHTKTGIFSLILSPDKLEHKPDFFRKSHAIFRNS